MKVNKKRFMNNLLTLGKIGLNEEDEINRICFSKEYYKALNILKKLFLEAILKVIIDKIGNITGYREEKIKVLKV